MVLKAKKAAVKLLSKASFSLREVRATQLHL